MEIIATAPTETQSPELTQIFDAVAAHYETLRDGQNDTSIEAGELRIDYFQSGRNVVYRVHGERLWYLKIPKNGKTDGLIGEARGYRFANDVWEQTPAYLPVEAVGVSHSPAFIVSAQVQGEQLNQVIYRSCWQPGSGIKQMRAVLGDFGEMLALFHKNGISANAPTISKSLHQKLTDRLKKAKKLDETGKKIEKWLATHSPVDPQPTLIHGNCTFRNVLVHNHRVHLLDYETCGTGSRYNDLARMCSDILLTRTALIFPWRRAYRLLDVFLQRYHDVYPIEKSLLMQFVSLYLFERYVQVYLVKKSSESIAGMPVSKAALRRLLDSLIVENIEDVFKNISL
ncbi:MAG: phosphotransferase [Calditrichia bacterium]|nr:phosphotransferase [Calditrichota bacterium]MCB0268307.1 phosphotransferase [Calditrichota bacterium]MCB9070030.1 phosphotransferase [Calditrichia bacterium]